MTAAFLAGFDRGWDVAAGVLGVALGVRAETDCAGIALLGMILEALWATFGLRAAIARRGEEEIVDMVGSV